MSGTLNQLTPPMSSWETVRWFGKDVISSVLYWCGVVWIYTVLRRRLGHHSLTIVAYHGVNDWPKYLNLFLSPGIFEAQIRFLRRRGRIIAFDEAEEVIAGRRPCTEDLFVLTFDDGYRDNWEVVLPVTRRFEAPITVFVATSFIDSQRPTLACALILAVDETRVDRLDLSELGLPILTLADGRSREFAVRTLDGYGRKLRPEAREQFLNLVLQRLQLANDRFAQCMLTWEQIRAMHDEGVNIGAHTITHPVLSELDAGAAFHEIRGSREIIEQRTGRQPMQFAYPYGGESDLTATTVDAVKRSGFSSAVVLQAVPVSRARIFELGRITLGPEMTCHITGRFSTAMAACELSGFFNSLRRLRPSRASQRGA